jgi:hypothetical protein
MSATIEVKYFNTFLIKKLKNVVQATVKPTAPFANVPHDFTADSTPNGGYDWYIEESRIRGGYNNTIVDLGVKAYLDEPEPLQQHRFNSLIYSGVFNSRTGVNQTNQFSIGEDITKSTDPANGSIQKLYAEDTNLIIFQQNKVSKALIDKDAIYSAEGNASITSTPLVIGQIVAYAGEYGISNDPFSFAVFGYRKYFTDKARGAVLRLSRDGITEISSYGMHDFFRDELAACDKIRAGWDGHSKNYIVSLQKSNGDYKTISFDEGVLGWTSFYSYSPNFLTSLKNNFYSLKTTINNGQGVWLHNAPAVLNGSSYGKFYETIFDSDVTVILNKEPSLVKNFKTINYEGADGWQMDEMFTNEYSAINTSGGDNASAVGKFALQTTLSSLETDIFKNNFKRKENKYFANLINTSNAIGGEVLWGASSSGIKGFWSTVKFKLINADYPTTKKELFAVSSDIVESSY